VKQPGELTVLVVDDDGVWRAALAGWLEREGFRVVGLPRGERVVQAVKICGADAVILDVHLPGLNGLEVLGAVRNMWPQLPVIVTTAFGGVDVAEMARRRGATSYLEKPFRMADLITELRRVIAPAQEQPHGPGR